MSNRDEFLAGTNPTNAASVLKLTLNETNAVLWQFTAQSNLFYAVESRTDLASAPWIVMTNVVGQSTVRTILVNASNPPPQMERYYRIVTPAVP
jgi:hypothetical protein